MVCEKFMKRESLLWHVTENSQKFYLKSEDWLGCVSEHQPGVLSIATEYACNGCISWLFLRQNQK
jgi:hypothetical protein